MCRELCRLSDGLIVLFSGGQTLFAAFTATVNTKRFSLRVAMLLI